MAEKYVEGRLVSICKALEVQVELTPDDEQKVRPVFDPAAMMAKLFGLMVYAGWNVQALPPSYTSVHANVEFWKNHMALEQAKEEAGAVVDTATDPPAA